MNSTRFTRRGLSACLLCLSLLACGLSAVGCATSARQKYEQASVALGGTGDAVRIAVSTKHVTDPAALAAMRFGLITARNALDKAYPLVLAGDKVDSEYWIGQVYDAIDLAAQQYAPKPTNTAATPAAASGAVPHVDPSPHR